MFRNSLRHFVSFAGCLVFGACAIGDPLAAPPVPGPAATVTRREAIEIAAAYASMRWTPEARHAFHGRDPDGIHVDTPDHEFRPPALKNGWWKPGETHTGMPYKWGGFDTPKSFQRGLSRGKYAGDIHTPQKRQMLEAAVSRHTVGIDCSGFISRCWRLDRSYSTRELANLSNPIPWNDLQRGDILNVHNHHVLMFAAWGRGRTSIFAYEAGPFPEWKVSLNQINVKSLQKQKFQPLRYRRIVDDTPPVE